MAKGKNKGWIMIIVWAFVGQNESRKNYYRAVLVWFVILAAITSALAALGFWPLIAKQIEMWMQGKGNMQHPTPNIQHPR